MATSDSNPFTEAPEEVTRYFDAKNSQPSYDWRDVAPYEHATTFTVAKTAGYDVLNDIRSAVSDARRNYLDFGTFADQLEPILRRKGWWGSKVHPETKELVKLGSLHRLRTIYWANMSTARAAGEWERTQRTKRALPFLVYELSTAENKRPLHQSWVGTILPVDDAWWSTHYPPNGWLCKCRVRQISRREAERTGYDPETPAPAGKVRRWTNKRTGEVWEVPEGIDPGWQGNPGLRRAENVQALQAGRLDIMTPVQRDVALKDMTHSRLFQAIQRNEFSFSRSTSPAELGHVAAPVSPIPQDIADKMAMDPHAPRILQFSVADAAKQASKGERAHFTPDLYEHVYRLMAEGEVFADVTEPGTYLFRGNVDGLLHMAVVRLTSSRKGVFLKSFRRTDEKVRSKWKRMRMK